MAKWRKLIQAVTEFESESAAQAALDGIAMLDGCVAARVIGDGRVKPFAVQAFFNGLPDGEQLPDGCRVVIAPPSLLAECEPGAARDWHVD